MEFLIILIKEIFRNKILVITLTVWALAQCIKVFLGVIRERRFNFRWFIGTGGMPSSHAAGATALATTIGMERGFDSVIFALSAVFALVTMFDAQGVRRATGQQAEILNRILEDIYWRGKIETNRLVELIGHTPIQVCIGSIIGCLMSIIFYSMWGR
ncbi:MAG TPA: divergent PAP2 family protein [Candidatus Omnitrophota bacterium]|nr:divergent PAP2 family protein [Candidatus Omnitrophota bacterium]